MKAIVIRRADPERREAEISLVRALGGGRGVSRPGRYSLRRRRDDEGLAGRRRSPGAGYRQHPARLVGRIT